MKQIILFLLTAFFSLRVSGQEKTEHLPFILLIDNEVPDPSIIHGIFLIKDSLGVVKDSVDFDYQVAELKMTRADYNRFFKIKQVYRIFIKFAQINLEAGTPDIYEKQIPNKYLNGEYPNGFINKLYFIVKIFNKSNADSRSKYYFKKDENYIAQVIIPGFSTLLSILKKE